MENRDMHRIQTSHPIRSESENFQIVKFNEKRLKIVFCLREFAVVGFLRSEPHFLPQSELKQASFVFFTPFFIQKIEK